MRHVVLIFLGPNAINAFLFAKSCDRPVQHQIFGKIWKASWFVDLLVEVILLLRNWFYIRVEELKQRRVHVLAKLENVAAPLCQNRNHIVPRVNDYIMQNIFRLRFGD